MPEAKKRYNEPAREIRLVNPPRTTRKISEIMQAVEPPLTKFDLLIEDELGVHDPLEARGHEPLDADSIVNTRSAEAFPQAEEISRCQKELDQLAFRLVQIGNYAFDDRHIRFLARLSNKALESYSKSLQEAARVMRGVIELDKKITNLKKQTN